MPASISNRPRTESLLFSHQRLSNTAKSNLSSITSSSTGIRRLASQATPPPERRAIARQSTALWRLPPMRTALVGYLPPSGAVGFGIRRPNPTNGQAMNHLAETIKPLLICEFNCGFIQNVRHSGIQALTRSLAQRGPAARVDAQRWPSGACPSGGKRRRVHGKLARAGVASHSHAGKQVVCVVRHWVVLVGRTGICAAFHHERLAADLQDNRSTGISSGQAGEARRCMTDQSV